MTKKTNFNLSDFNEICRMLNTITNLDTQLIDKDGIPIFQLVKNKLSIALKNLQNDTINICNLLRNNKLDSYYHYINSYGLEYISCGIWFDKSFNGVVSI